MKIQDIKGSTFILGLFDLLFLISPGIAIIFLFFPSLVIELDWIKLIFIAITVTVPTTLLMTVLLATLRWKSIPNMNADKDDLFLAFSLGTVGNGIGIYFLLLIQHFYQVSLENLFMVLFVGLSISTFCATLKKKKT